MLNVESQADVRSVPVLPLTTTLGEVVIAVTDRDRALAIWQDVVGLDLIAETAQELRLGAGGKVFSGSRVPLRLLDVAVVPDSQLVRLRYDARP